jgi:dimethylglycine dehydrogenase
MGDLTITCWTEDDFWLMGSYYLRQWHLRWFEQHLADAEGVAVQDISDAVGGLSISGPHSRELLARITGADVSDAALRRMRATTLDVGLVRARVARLALTGELGFELNVASGELPALYRTVLAAGDGLGVLPIGYTSLNAMRLEKSYGIWSREFTWAYTPGMSGLDRFVAFEKPSFTGRDAALRERDAGGAAQRLVTLQVHGGDADASAFDPVWHGERRVGFVTSGGYGHHLRRSLALAYVDRALAEPGTLLDAHVVGVRTPVEVIPDSPYDPQARRPRS